MHQPGGCLDRQALGAGLACAPAFDSGERNIAGWLASDDARRWLILFAIGFSRLAFGYQFQLVGSIGPELMTLFDIGYTTLGALVGAYMLLGIFSALPLGLLGRRFGEHLVVGAGLSLMAAGALVCMDVGGALGATRAIFLGRCLSGVGAVAMIVLQGKMIADWCQGRQLMMGLGISVAAFPIGVGSAQLVAPSLAQAYGWPAAFLSGAGLAALAAVWFIVAYRPSPFARPVPRSFSLPGARECVMVVIGGLIWTFYTSPYASFLAYAPAMLTNRGESAGMTALVITIATWGNVPAILLGGSLAMRFGHLRLFLIGTLTLASGLVAIGAVGWPILCALLIGVIGSVHPSVIMAAGTLSARPENRAVGMSLFYTTYYVGGTIVPAICGHAGDVYGGAEGALYAAAGVSLLAIPAFLLHQRLRSWARVPGLE